MYKFVRAVFKLWILQNHCIIILLLH